jgi:hypothetical protein
MIKRKQNKKNTSIHIGKNKNSFLRICKSITVPNSFFFFLVFHSFLFN